MPFTLAEAVEEVENATVAAIWRQPDTVIVERPGWYQFTTASSRLYWMNGVARSVLSSEEAAEVVGRTVAAYRSAELGFRWTLGPGAAPAHLAELLEREGMRLMFVARGMVADVPTLEVNAGPGVIVERATLANVDDYVRASAAGWGNTTEAAREIRANMIRSLRDPSNRTLYYIARVDGVPAGSGGLLPLASSGYLLGSSVDPEYRGRGVYRALVAARVATLREMGLPLVTILASSETSAPICSRLGFETVCEARIYAWEPSQD
ncbi:GNAT family N-acetyltransferase [Vulgatibacter incomptus]|uniref:Acetyltransferase, GNAT family n=1 Tax=Vulgatibacter incomptus TaxID=1391653 RepID=A0A0K1PGV2_9BACT|nr:GNAT family N-acetyltransferase [Vulgatibacter incomptus]AKU92727.1 acetyltransferase, GNAT family [Vulgatibacter incomptus]